jgi:hypothetical protein
VGCVGKVGAQEWKPAEVEGEVASKRMSRSGASMWAFVSLGSWTGAKEY